MKYLANFMHYLTRDTSQNLTGILIMKLFELCNVDHNTANLMPNISKFIIYNEFKKIDVQTTIL